MKKLCCFVALAAAVSLFTVACNDDGGGGGSGVPSSIAGQWSGSGNYDQGTAIQTFILILTQNGNALSGSYSVKRTGRGQMNGSVNGSISGNAVNVTMSPHGRADGTVNGNAMTLYWYESGFGGSGGGGTVNLSR